jgi:NAD(P)-dependent dehydrogenase (short-subunit alcohol dehydrogenase family)
VDIAAWLHGLGLQQYEQAFRDNAIDAAVLPELTAEDLKDLGVNLVGHRRRLLAAIAALRSPLPDPPPPAGEGRVGASAREAVETADLCRAANDAVKVVQADVASDEDCRRLAAAASDWGRLDILINNASATKHVANPADRDALSAEDFQRLYAINTIGPFQMVRAARSLLEAGRAPRSVLPRSSIFLRSVPSMGRALRSPIRRAKRLLTR